MTPFSGLQTRASRACGACGAAPLPSYWRRPRRSWGSRLASGTPPQSAQTRRPLQRKPGDCESRALPQLPPRTTQRRPPLPRPGPELFTRGRKARCSLCSSDRSSSIFARPPPSFQLRPRPRHFRSRVRSRRRSDASASGALGSGRCWSPAPRSQACSACCGAGGSGVSDRKYPIRSRLGGKLLGSVGGKKVYKT